MIILKNRNTLSDEIINDLKERIHGTIKSLLGWYININYKKECTIIDITQFILDIFIKEYNHKNIIKYILNKFINQKYFIYISLIDDLYILKFIKNNSIGIDESCIDIFFINISSNLIHFQKINTKTKLMLYASIDVNNIYFK
jgi:hypothetical protein